MRGCSTHDHGSQCWGPRHNKPASRRSRWGKTGARTSALALALGTCGRRPSRTRSSGRAAARGWWPPRARNAAAEDSWRAAPCAPLSERPLRKWNAPGCHALFSSLTLLSPSPSGGPGRRWGWVFFSRKGTDGNVTEERFVLTVTCSLCLAAEKPSAGGARGGGGAGRDALEGKGPQRRFQKRLDRPTDRLPKRLGMVTVGYKCH